VSSYSKKYYWLKLKEDFFQQKEIKKLRKIAGGDTYTVIYLKMQLLSIKTEGKILFDGIEDNFAEEMALILDEDVDNVRMTIMFLQKYGLLDEVNAEEYFLPEASKSIGSETQGAERVRKHRDQQKVLQCNNNVTELKLIETISNKEETESNTLETKCNTDIEIEIDKDIERSSCPNFVSDEEKNFNNLSQSKQKENHDGFRLTTADPHFDVCLELSQQLLDKIQKNNPKAKQPNIIAWAKNIDLMIRIDKRDVADIRSVIDWCQKDNFWKSNILSTDKLRQQFDQLYIKMQNKSAVKPNIVQTHNNFQQRTYAAEDFEKYYQNVAT
jgi:predicted phage replisome organizer